MNGFFRRIYSFTLVWILLSITVARGQTIISPTGDGGFETGATFALNGWTAVNDANSKWYVGTFTKSLGTRACYIDVNANAGTTNNYNTNVLLNRISHFYRDVTIPSGATNIVLSFKWKAAGENGTAADDYDFIRVSLAPTSVTPAATNLVSSLYTIGAGKYNLQGTAYQTATINLSNSLAGTTQRLIFTWKNDISVTNNPGGAIDEVSLTYTPGSACTGTPAPGNTLSTSSSVCAATSFTLSLQNSTPGTGVTYQWQSSPNNSTWSNITSATSSSLITTQSTATYYRCLVTCSSNTGTSNPIQVNMNPSYACVCTPSYTNSCSIDYIANVNFAGINRTSTCDGATPSNRTLYTTPNPTIMGGVTYPISVTTDGDDEGINVWIDYNKNGVFESTESVLSGFVASTPQTYTANVTVPLTVTNGQTIMRVRCQYNAAVTDPCANYTYGETEDYYITLAEAPPCINPPVGGTISGSLTACTGSNNLLSLSGGSGAVQWQSSTSSASGPFTDISGATASSYTLNSANTGTIYIRAKRTELGCTDAFSNVLTISINPGVVLTASSSASTVCPGTSVNLTSSAGLSYGNTNDYPIPDFVLSNGIVNSPIVVSGLSPATISATTVKSVSFNINHTFVGDLRIRLFSPAGNAATIVDQIGGSGQNFVNTTVVNSGAPNGNISAASAPFTGTYNSTVSFATLTGATNGTWNLRAIDLTSGDVGTILDWTLVLESDGVTYTWTSNPSGTNSNLQNITVTPLVPTTYTVTGAAGGCSDDAALLINTSPLPELSVSSNAPVCEGQDINLVASNDASGQSSGNTFTWSGPNGFISSSSNPTISGSSAINEGYYVVTVQNSFGCTDIDSANVFLNEIPDLNIFSQTNVTCNGALTGDYTIEVTNAIPGGNYLFNDGVNINFDGIFSGVGAGTYNVEVTDDNSCSNTIAVTITEPDPTTIADAGVDQTVCFGSIATLAGNTASVGVGSWSVIAGSGTVTDPSDPNSTVNGLSVGVNTFRWTIDNVFCANSNFDEVTINVNPLPTASMSGTTSICTGNSTTLSLVFTGTGPWIYSYSDGTTTFGPFTANASPELITVSPSTSKTYTAVSVADANCSGGGVSGNAVITVDQAPPANSVTITSLPVSGCVGNVVTVSTNSVIFATTYTWSAPAGTLINGQAGPVSTSSPTATLTLGALPANSSGWEICVQASNACGVTNTQCRYIRGALSLPASITGSNVACASTSGTYSTLPVVGASGYTWSGTNGITFTGSGTSVTANFPAGFTTGQICVAANLACGYTGPQRCLTVTNSVASLGLMNGPFAVCPGQGGLVFSVPASNGVATYNWVAPANVTIASGQGTNSITISVGAGFTVGNLCVTATSTCGVVSSSRCKTINSQKPATPGNITGAANGVCNSSSIYSVPAISGISNYLWTVPSGATIVNGQGTNVVEIGYTNSFTTGQVCVTANNTCGASTARCINVKGAPSTPGLIGGPATVCDSEEGISYLISPVYGANTYTWTVPSGATIVAGQNTNNVIVDWGTLGGFVSVIASNGCGVSGTRTLSVIVNCKLSSVSIPDVAIQAYPNPVSGILNVEVETSEQMQFELQMTDLSGRVVYSSQIAVPSGTNSEKVDVSNLAGGMYILTMKNQSGYSKQLRITVE